MSDKQKILILGDLHTETYRANRIIAAESPDLTVLCGDYFDEFNDSPRINGEMAAWIKEKLSNKNFVCLLGNHDVSYLCPTLHTLCSGYTTGKQMAIDTHLGELDLLKFKWYYWLNSNTLISHAGISYDWTQELKVDTKQLSSFRSWLTQQGKEANTALLDHTNHWFLNSGFSRGGRYRVGGMLWCDWKYEFRPIQGINQIVGHSFHPKVRFKNTTDTLNCCIDTKLAYYLVFIDDKIEIKAYSDL